MTGHRTFVVPAWPTFGAIGMAVAAAGVLLTFPGLRLWQVAAWTLVFALLALLGLVLASAWSLASNREARTWPRILGVTLGAACLAAITWGAI